MSFQVELKTNNSDTNVLDKSTTTITTMSGTLREKCSIINPVVIVAADVDDLADCNYMTISKFNRSYFVNNIVSVREGLCELHAHTDVLSSFASEIRSNSGIMYRQENDWNAYLNDGSFKVFAQERVSTHPFPAGFPSTAEFVLAVAGS